MNLLINSLDNHNNDNGERSKVIEVRKISEFSDNIYDIYFPSNYEGKFKPYDDLDKCNEGFISYKRESSCNVTE